MKSNHEIKTKAVSFNILDPDQLNLYEHAMKRKNFSAYVKRLIQRDFEGTFHVNQMSAHIESTSKPQAEEVILNDDLMNGLL